MTYNITDQEKRELQGAIAALLLDIESVENFTQYKRISAIVTTEEITLLNKLHGILERNEEVTLLFRH